MAEKYHCLPSEILEKGSTLDIQIHMHSVNYRDREMKKRNGEDITNTYNEEELVSLYNRGKEVGEKYNQT